MAGLLLIAIWIAGAAGVGLWFARVQASTGLRTLAAAAVVVAGGAAAVGWLRSAAGAAGQQVLAWDGQYWTLGGAGQVPQRASNAFVHIDLQALMLVRLAEPGGRMQWLWLERRRAPGRWLALRRALYARLPGQDTGRAAPSIAS